MNNFLNNNNDDIDTEEQIARFWKDRNRVKVYSQENKEHLYNNKYGQLWNYYKLGTTFALFGALLSRRNRWAKVIIVVSPYPFAYMHLSKQMVREYLVSDLDCAMAREARAFLRHNEPNADILHHFSSINPSASASEQGAQNEILDALIKAKIGITYITKDELVQRVAQESEIMKEELISKVTKSTPISDSNDGSRDSQVSTYLKGLPVVDNDDMERHKKLRDREVPLSKHRGYNNKDDTSKVPDDYFGAVDEDGKPTKPMWEPVEKVETVESYVNDQNSYKPHNDSNNDSYNDSNNNSYNDSNNEYKSWKDVSHSDNNNKNRNEKSWEDIRRESNDNEDHQKSWDDIRRNNNKKHDKHKSWDDIRRNSKN